MLQILFRRKSKDRKPFTLLLLLLVTLLAYSGSAYEPAAQTGSLLPTSDFFAVGSRVAVDGFGARVRSGPSILDPWIGTQDPGSLGTIIKPCRQDFAGFRVYCGVDFDTDPDGWVRSERLVLIANPPPTPTPTPTPEPSPTPTPEPSPTPTPEPSPTPSAESPNNTRVPPATQIVDSNGDVWTRSNDGAILRNGAGTAGAGSQILYCNRIVYVFGTDSQWYRWNNGWILVGSTDPCGGPTPMPTPTPTPEPSPTPTPEPSPTPTPEPSPTPTPEPSPTPTPEPSPTPTPEPSPTPTPEPSPTPTPEPSPTPTATPTPSPSMADHYVNPLGSDSNPGTLLLPFRTIQRAADVVNPGETVIVQDGIYTDEDGDGVIVNLSRGGTADATIIFKAETRWGAKLDGRNNAAHTGFRFQSTANYIRIEGFEIYGLGNGVGGGASGIEIYNGGHDSEIVANNIHDIGRMCTDTTNGEVGVFVQQPRVLLEGNLIHNIGRFAPGEQGCQPAQPYYKNHDHGIYINRASDLTIQNNVFHDCKRGWAIQIYPGPSNRLKIYNNTFAFENPYNPGHIIVAAAGSDNEIKNNIFYDPLSAAIYFYSGLQSNTEVANNLTYGGAISTGNASGVTFTSNINDLLGLIFISIELGDFHLSLLSPARDAGLDIPSVTKDFNGIPRPQGPRYDVGAYELIP